MTGVGNLTGMEDLKIDQIIWTTVRAFSGYKSESKVTSLGVKQYVTSMTAAVWLFNLNEYVHAFLAMTMAATFNACISARTQVTRLSL